MDDVLVAAFLVTGNPGSGKSALARELVRRGVPAIDPDDDPQLSYREDAVGLRVCGPPCPDQEWLRSHRWVWSRGRLEEIPGRAGPGDGRAVFEAQMLRQGALAIDATTPGSCGR